MTTTTHAAAPTSTDPVDAYGWEMHCTAGTSDKFYRVIVIDTLVVAIYGARNTAGQVIVYRHPTPREAVAKAEELTDEKEQKKGYHVTRDFTAFTVTPESVASVGQIGAKDRVRDAGHYISSTFMSAADQAGTTKAGASR